MAIEGLVVDDGSQSVYQDINLEDLLGTSEINESTKRAIAVEVIDAIVERAQSGLNYDNRRMKKYSDSYAESEQFRAAGKSQGDVNMTLYGDMLAQMELVEIKGNTIRIGWSDSEQATKAYAHMSGFKGHPHLDGKVSQRKFFGAPIKMLQDIASNYRIGNQQENNDVLSALEILERATTSTRDDFSLIFGND